MNIIKTIFFITLVFTVLISCGPGEPFELNEVNSPYKGYSTSTVKYFLEIGLCPEFGECPIPSIKKWQSPVRVQLYGRYTQDDEKELEEIIEELADLTGLSVNRVNDNSNINIHIVEQKYFKNYISSYNENNPQDGYFTIFDNSNGIYTQAIICIRSDLKPIHKRHLLREELTQSMGILNDSTRYPTSIFQQNPRYQPTEYSPIDKQVIRLLYDSRIKPLMTAQEIELALKKEFAPVIAKLHQK